MQMFRSLPQPIIDTMSLANEDMSLLVNANDCDRPLANCDESRGIPASKSSPDNDSPKPRNNLLNIFKEKPNLNLFIKKNKLILFT